MFKIFTVLSAYPDYVHINDNESRNNYEHAYLNIYIDISIVLKYCALLYMYIVLSAYTG